MDIEKDEDKKQPEETKVENDSTTTTVTAMVEEKQDPEELKKKEQEHQKQILRDKFLLVNARLSTGCKRERCKFDTCICFPGNAHLKGNSNAVKLRSLELVKQRLGTIEVCQILENPIHSLQANELDQLCQVANFNEILHRVGSVFSDIDSLSCSFFDKADNNLNNIHTDKHHGHIDFTALNNLFSFLLSSSNLSNKEEAENTLKSSFENLLKNFNTTESFQKEFNNFDSLRVIAIILFYLGKLSDSHEFFEVIWKHFIFINEDQMQTLGYYLIEMNQTVCQNLNSNMHTEVMIHLFDAETQQKDLEEVEVAMNILKILYLSNTLNKRLERDAFMMSLFDQNQEECLHPLEEYKAWRQMRSLKNKNKRVFSFCMYPFSMDIKFKYLLLEINSKFAQKQEHDQLIRSLIDQGQMFVDSHQLYLIFEVGRETILNDTLTAISKPNQNYKLPFKVKFKGEQGIDEGGVRKEYYQIMIKQLFNADFGLFNEKQNKQYFWFNGNSLDMPMLFELIGSLMGIAIYNQIQMDVRLPHVVYKKLIGDPVSLSDIEQFDLATFKGLSHILAYEGDLENDLQQTFAIEYEVYGETHQQELLPGGEHIPVTQNNKEEYVELYVDWILNKSIERQFNNFKRGFFKVIDADITKLFTFDELVLILTGKEELDFNELRANTVYDQGYTDDSDQVKWLWEILDDFEPLMKKKFLFFCTGSDRAPVTGFASFKFIIARNGDDNSLLPSSHTCFNHLLIPEYKSKEILKEKLLISLENAEGFGMY